MGEIITVLLQSLQLIGKFFDLWREQDSAKAKAKKEALNEVIQGAAESDTRAITMGFDKFNSIK